MASKQKEEASYVDKLTADNYQSWKFRVQMVLKGKELWEITSGDETLDENATEEMRQKFKKKENQAHAIVCLAVSDPLLIYVRTTKTAKEAWDSLSGHFEEKSLSKKIFYRRKLYSTKMRMGECTMIDHVNKLKTIAEQLEALDDPVSDKDLVMILISSLPDEYNNLITALETLKEDSLTWNYVRDRVINEFERRKSERSKKSDQEALYVNMKYKKGGGGHTSNKKKGIENFKCHYCKEKGHFLKDCPKKNNKKQEKQETESSSFCQGKDAVEEVSACVESCHFEPEFALTTDDEANDDDDDWWIDSACSRHMSGNEKDFVSIEKLEKPVNVNLADKSVVPAAGVGNVNLVLVDEDGNNVPVVIRGVLYVPRLKKKLISVPTLDERGAEISFKNGVCSMTAGKRKFVFGHKEGKLYKVITASVSCNFTNTCVTSQLSSLNLWHLRLGHLNNQDVKKLCSEKMVKGLNVNPKDVPSDCEGCYLGKQSRLPFPKKSSGKKAKILDLVHSDVCGPMSVPSVGGSIYFSTFIDDHSNFTWVYMLKQKSEVGGVFLEWLTMVENLTEKRLKEFRSDNGGEYIAHYFTDLCKDRGIALQPTIPYTPQQNGVAERMNRTIMDNVRATLYHAKLPVFLWAEAVATIVYLRNLCPTSSFKGVTPYERFFCVKPDVGHLRVFGCTAFVHVPDTKRKKLDPKAIKGIFVGYPTGSKGYKIYLPDSRKMIRSRDVKFLENSFPGSNECKPDEFFEVKEASSHTSEFFLPADNPDSDSSSETDQEEIREIVRSTDMFRPAREEIGEIVPSPDMSRPARNRRNPDRYGEWATVTSVDVEIDPKTYKQAMKSPNSQQWEKAMQDELSSLNKHNTWDLVDLPVGKNLIGCKWVFKTKRNASGFIDRFKARLVAQGYSQEYGIDYDEVFAPVARYDSIRSVLAIGTQENFEIHQMDVKSAFLNGELEEELYMKQPEGFINKEHSEKVCRLKRSLYGLKQSARCWNLVIDSFLKSMNYKQNVADPCVYYKHEVVDGKKIIMLIAVYVDDSILCSNQLDALKTLKKHLCERFEMDDRGEVHYILGMTVKRDRINHITTIDQKFYLQNVLVRFGMENSKPMSTPVDPDTKFVSLSEDEKSFDVTLFQAVIGSLNYAAICTRPDLSTAVGMLSKFMQRPGKEHWVGIKRVLRYVQGTINYGLVFRRSDDFRLQGFSDSDWAGCAETRKSTSGLVCRLGNCTVSWRSKKQPIVALSSTEAEYIALCSASQEVVWLRRLLHGVGQEQSGATVVFEDNQGAMSLSRNPKDHSRTKHIDVKYHFVRESVEKEIIRVVYCPTAEMVADILTKGLARLKFEKFREAMGVLDVTGAI